MPLTQAFDYFSGVPGDALLFPFALPSDHDQSIGYSWTLYYKLFTRAALLRDDLAPCDTFVTRCDRRTILRSFYRAVRIHTKSDKLG